MKLRTRLPNLRWILLATFLGSVFHFPGRAQVGLHEYLEVAMKNNLSVQASFKQYEASLEVVHQKGALPDPQFSTGIFLRPMELLMGNQRAEMSLMQMFPWFGMNKAQKNEAILMAEAEYHAFRGERNKLLLQVKETYFDLLKLQSNIDLAKENLGILLMLEDLALVKYRVGNASLPSSNAPELKGARTSSSPNPSTSKDNMGMGAVGTSSQNSGASPQNAMDPMGAATGSGNLTDVLRIQVQRMALESEIDQLRLNMLPLQLRFNQLLGRDSNAEVVLAWPADIDESYLLDLDALDSLFANNPMVNMLEKESEAFMAQSQMAKLEGRPMMGLGLNYMVFNSRPESGMVGGMDGMEYMPAGMGRNMLMPMFTMTLPIYRRKYKSKQLESDHLRESSHLQKVELERVLETDLEAAIVALKDAKRKQQLLTDQVAITEKIVEMTLVSYTVGESSMEEVLSSQKELLAFAQEKFNARSDAQLALSRIETLVGL